MALGLFVSSMLMLFLIFDKDNRTVEGEYRITSIYSIEDLGSIEVVKLHSLFEDDEITLHIPSRQLYESDLDIIPGDVVDLGGVRLRARSIVNSEYRFEVVLFGFNKIEQVRKNLD